MTTEANSSPNEPINEPRKSFWSSLLTEDDWWAVWIGCGLLIVCLTIVIGWHWAHTADTTFDAKSAGNPIKGWLTKPGSWSTNPVQGVLSSRGNAIPGLLCVFVVGLLAFGLAAKVMGTPFLRFAIAFLVVFLLAVLAYVLAGQEVVRYLNLSYALWALLIGLVISNTIGTPDLIRPAVRTEFYIKTGLVLLGGELLLNRLLSLGVPGIFVAWIVTPIVLVGTYIFGQYVLKIKSRSLNMVISADMSVCGVSAAIAAAAACRAKKEELTLAVGMSLTFTVVMMVAMPAFIRATGMSDVLGAAWMGGTIDSTGAVAAAGGILGDRALTVATTVKMIQNILIGVIAFGIAVYWTTFVDTKETGSKPSVKEIWYRFPKFVIGFIGASVFFTAVYFLAAGGPQVVNATLDNTKVLRGWFFCLAFVSIGLATNFRELAGQLAGGKPLWLYLIGQTFNLILTLFMAWLMFEVLFADVVQEILQAR